MTAHGRAPMALPADLRERVLAAARQARAAGRPTPETTAICPAEAFSRAADALFGLLRTLDDKDWRLPVLRGLDVQGLVGHLIGVEDDVHRCLCGDPEVAEASHIASTQPAAARQAGRPPAQTRTEWRRAADRTAELVRARGDLDGEVAVHGMRLPLGALLVVRAFELWTHDNDIRRAAGLPSSVPDASMLRLMSELAARLLPYGAARTGLRETVNVHLVLPAPVAAPGMSRSGAARPGAARPGGARMSRSARVRPVPPASALSPTRSGSAGWPPTGSPPPISTCTSAATPAGPPGYLPRLRHSHSTRACPNCGRRRVIRCACRRRIPAGSCR